MAPLRHLRTSDPPVSAELISAIRSISTPFHGEPDLDPLLERVGDARYVLLGEASHGTHEFYTWRSALTRRLIEEKGFSFIAVEGDWPDCERVNRYVKGRAEPGASAASVVHEFGRWPTWMWANREIVELVHWLRHHNDHQPDERKVGFYGLDVYSLWESLDEIFKYLRENDPSALPLAYRAINCFEPYGHDEHEYARATRLVNASCEADVVILLGGLRRSPSVGPGDRAAGARSSGDAEAQFNAEQNAIVVRDAERYYRAMLGGGPLSWNLRDQHMFETLERLMTHHGPATRCIVWEHNTHIGDARHTDMADDGMINVGQLVRENHPGRSLLVGFSSYQGEVIAGESWGAEMKRLTVPPARPGSWEDALRHASSGQGRLLLFGKDARHSAELIAERGHRAIGVVYHPARDRYANYVPTAMALRYDAMIALDRTSALHPLHMPPSPSEIPDTYPTGY